MRRSQVSVRPSLRATVVSVVLLLSLFITANAFAENIVYPAGANVLNVKNPPYNAAGNGVTDDTAAIQQAIIDAFNTGRRIVYIPNGTYIVSATLKSNDPNSTFNEGWFAYSRIQGQSRAGAILKLKNAAAGFTDPANPKPVIQNGSEDYGNNYVNGEGNQAFGNYIRNLTVDTGANNPGAIGIDFQGSNFAALRDVTIKSSDATKRGKVGLFLERRDNGPALIKNVSVDGFDYGVSMRQEIAQFAFEFLTLTNQKVGGFYLDGIAAIRKLTSTNTVPAIEVRGNGLLNLLDSTLSGGTAGTSAVNLVDGESRALLRDVTASGYARVVTNRGTNVAGTTLRDWVSDPVNSKFPSPGRTQRLPIEETPAYWNATLSNWANVQDYGATVFNNSDDDAPAIQAALNSGKPVIYFPAGDYDIGQTITVPATVRHIIGVGSVFINAKVNLYPMFRFTGGDASQTTLVEQFNLGGQPANGFDHSDARTLVLSDVGTFNKYCYSNFVIGNKLFLDNVAGGGYAFYQPSKVWARQWNNEGYGNPKGELRARTDIWALGVKSEGGEALFSQGAGSRLEVFGGFMYSFGVDGNLPLFSVSEGVLTASFATISYVNGPFDLLVRDTRNTVTQEFRKADAIGRGWGNSVPLYVSYPVVGPVADAFVRDGSSAGTNYGSQTTLTVKKDTAVNSGNNRHAYLKFDTASLSGGVGRAILRLYGKYNGGAGTSTTLSAYSVSDTTWTEGGITWNNKPALGAKQGGSVTVTPTAQYYEFDVTSYVLNERSAGRNTVSFAITGDAATSPTTDFNSKEASFGKPELVITNPTTTRLNCGGGANGGFDDDNTNLPVGNTGTYFTSDPIDVSSVTNPAPQSVYQSERNDLGGGFTYTFGDLGAGTPYRVRLHFVERYFSTNGSRVFNVGINGTTVLSNFDIRAAAGATNKAIVQEFNGTADANGQIIISFASVVDRALINGIEILPVDSAPNTGTGLKAQYFNNVDLSGSPALTQTDANVDFYWGGGSYTSGGPADNFSARWEGQVEAPVAGTYTFYTRSDDGVRLWVNGVQIINNWTDHAATDDTGSQTFTLSAGQRVSIRMEFYERNGDAEARLSWSYPGQGRVAIPQSRLYPAP